MQVDTQLWWGRLDDTEYNKSEFNLRYGQNELGEARSKRTVMNKNEKNVRP